MNVNHDCHPTRVSTTMDDSNQPRGDTSDMYEWLLDDSEG